MTIIQAGLLFPRLGYYFAGLLLVFRRLDSIFAKADRSDDFDFDPSPCYMSNFVE